MEQITNNSKKNKKTFSKNIYSFLLRILSIHLMAFLLFSSITNAATIENKFTVIKVHDGDTFKAEGHGIKIKVRLVGIDAPELSKKNKPDQPFAKEAKCFLSKMILNEIVQLKNYGIGPYNRQICEVFKNGKNINVELIRIGLAQIYGGKHPKNFDCSKYKAAQNKAKKQKKGIWNQKHYISPDQWRKSLKSKD